MIQTKPLKSLAGNGATLFTPLPGVELRRRNTSTQPGDVSDFPSFVVLRCCCGGTSPCCSKWQVRR
jgi:hypothetical protein